MTSKIIDTNLMKKDPVFGQLSFDGHEQIVFCNDEDTGLKAIIGIHNTVLGPALGGTRMWTYQSEWHALNDVLRLSRGMTYKSAITGLNLGGGKAVIIGDAKTQKNDRLMRRFGEFVNSLSLALELNCDISEGVDLAACSVKHYLHKKKLLSVNHELKNGHSLSSALDQTSLFSKLDIASIQIAENSHSLKQTMKVLASENVKKRLKNLNLITQIISPVAILLLGVVIFVVYVMTNRPTQLINNIVPSIIT